MLRVAMGTLYKNSFRIKLLFSYWLIILIPMLSAFLIFGLNLYNQTKSSYETILNQYSDRANISLDDFISNVTRNTFFYITNSSLTKIIEKPYVQNAMEFYEDNIMMQRAMDQIVLMNGNITGVTISAFNGKVYSSAGANPSYMNRLLQTVSKSELYKGKALVTAPYTGSNNYNKQVSIIRYLFDLDTNKQSKEGYVKIDVKFQTIETMLGGISDSNMDIGTIVVADRDVIYLSENQTVERQDVLNVLPRLAEAGDRGNKAVHMKIKNEHFLLSVKKMKSTDWLMVHFIPENIIKAAFQRSIMNYALTSILSLFFAFILAVMLSRYFFKPIHRVRKAMKLVDSGTLEPIADDDNRQDELGQLVQSYNAMIRRLRTSRETEMKAVRLQKKAELTMLQSQINPHFLYNTLNVIHSISELHRIGEISIMAKSLASLYRYNLKSKDIVTIGSELEQIKNYINIQKIRFVDKVEVIYDIEEDVLQYRILKFLIQPIVENSFYHGLERKEGKGRITISAAKAGHSILIRVADDGAGMSEQKARELIASLEDWESGNEEESKTNFGLRNVSARIRHFYGNDCWLRVHSKLKEGTRVEIKIPAETEMTEHEYRDR
ncbi:sensor histidine kinase [Paenibacillus alkalitolerans]|uniref:sensor histidine kinase n=1 Tax=Paenibacillus alkalitolerans TaxID=2799335 RepID=UPI0018F32B2B|nr:sensor histidine kinase [Paenibacillus alkalitolerans]